MVEVIAEAGSNHNGSVERAIELVDAAARSGASSIKFQFIHADGLYLPRYRNASQTVQSEVYRVRRSEELTEEEWSAVWQYAANANLEISASVFDARGLHLLRRLGAPYVKIASTDVYNHELISLACENFSRVIISTGMAYLSEIDETFRFIASRYPTVIIELMHCASIYPCSVEEANVQRVEMLRQCFPCPVGYSDHTAGSETSVMALVKGASLFEKHFTLDRKLPGFDHSHALEPEDLAKYVSVLRSCAASLARPANRMASEEAITRLRARRGVYARRALPRGHVLSREDLLFVRPSTTFRGPDLSDFIGAELQSDIEENEPLILRPAIAKGESNWAAADRYWTSEMREKGMKS